MTPMSYAQALLKRHARIELRSGSLQGCRGVSQACIVVIANTAATMHE
jgi:hypothetical protein